MQPEARTQEPESHFFATAEESCYFERLVEGIQNRDQSAEAETYELLHRSVRYSFASRVPERTNDLVQDLFVALFSQIRRGMMQEPAKLPAYARAIAANMIRHEISSLTFRRARFVSTEDVRSLSNAALRPDAAIEESERVSLMREGLRKLPERDRDILERFYLLEQTPQQICAEVNITDTQFRLCKSRAKAKLTQYIAKCSKRNSFRLAERRAAC